MDSNASTKRYGRLGTSRKLKVTVDTPEHATKCLRNGALTCSPKFISSFNVWCRGQDAASKPHHCANTNVGSKLFRTMKQLQTTILLTLISISSFGQQYNFDLDKIKFNGLVLKTTKKVIAEKFGQGRRVETNYECGFFTNDLPGGPYYQLVYTDFTFIGNDKEYFLSLIHI